MHITDPLGNELYFKHKPERIVSLVPSQTELLVALGLVNNVVGVTKFCVHPPQLRKEKTVVGGTKKVNLSKIADLHPDCILCNKEENTKEMVSQLQEIAPVHVSNNVTFKDALSLIEQYGILFNKGIEATAILSKIEEERINFRKSFRTDQFVAPRVGYVIWNEPLMVAGGATFIDTMLSEAGFENAFATKKGRYPEVELEELKKLDYIFLSSEPFPFREAHTEAFARNSTATVVLVDGEYFSWYGSRLIGAFSYFKKLRSRLKV